MQRTIRIESEPSGALVFLNDREVGRTPVEVGFTYYGVYDVRLTKEGFAPLMTSAEAETPVYELPVIDIVAGALFQPKTRVEWFFELEASEVDADAVIARARALREQVGGDVAAADADERGGEPIPIEGDEQRAPDADLPPLLPPDGAPTRPPEPR